MKKRPLTTAVVALVWLAVLLDSLRGGFGPADDSWEALNAGIWLSVGVVVAIVAAAEAWERRK